LILKSHGSKIYKKRRDQEGVTAMKEKMYRFMQGRYGNDNLNRFLLIVIFICFILSLFCGRAGIFQMIGAVCLVCVYFRMFSRNIYKRRAENSAYLKYEYKVKQLWLTFKRDMKQRKTHHIYRCPSCRQKIRIPRGKGKIEIRCPKCNTTFMKKS